MNIAVLASGNGSNFEALVKAQRQGKFSATITMLITDKENAFVRTRARKFDVPDLFIDPAACDSRESFDCELVDKLKANDIDLVILAGYMRILSRHFVRSFPHRIVNIHPSLLPMFPGIGSIRKAFEAKVDNTGVTVHLVDEGVDSGPVILQETVPILPQDTLDDLEKRVHSVEHRLYPQAIKLITESRFEVQDNRIRFI
jgi:phosphoribosylglycinamide formyltransferase-1